MEDSRIKELGFELVKEYGHDQFIARRFKKGLLELEVTRQGQEVVSVDVTTQEINALPVNESKLILMDQVINGTKPEPILNLNKDDIERCKMTIIKSINEELFNDNMELNSGMLWPDLHFTKRLENELNLKYLKCKIGFKKQYIENLKAQEFGDINTLK